MTVGIDLGTTHCVVAYARGATVEIFDIAQLVAPGEIAARPLLPSLLYLAGPELAANDTALPWGAAAHVVGEAARALGAKTPDRLVASAKSWVCYGGINRRAAVLPWSAPDELPHVSPFDAQVAFLQHLRAAWEHAHAGAPLASQDVIVTVPASFDDGAKDITLQAAEAAGLGQVQLLEEPQAAFYDFIAAHPEALGDAKLVLVVDVGGGTTDLTLLRTTPRLERIAVGGHLLLGGDNMDAALAHHVLAKAALDRPLDASEWSALTQSARQVKERLLGDAPPNEAVVSIQRRSARLLGATRSVTLDRADVLRLLLDGFVPTSTRDELADRSARSGLTTLGLPYATDPAIPRHVCAFLKKHAIAAKQAGAHVEDGLPRPDAVLLNGGVLKSATIAERLLEVMRSWFSGNGANYDGIKLLPHTSLDTAVAAGAVRFALAKRGVGRVISGGSPRAYYVGVDSPQGKRALCVVPRGLEPDTTVKVDRTFDLVLDQPVAFSLYASTGDRIDPPGALVAIDAELDSLPPLQTLLRGADNTRSVRLSATLTERGALELYLVSLALPPRRWRLEFALAAPPQKQRIIPLSPHLTDAKRVIERAPSSRLRNELEALLGDRGTWSAPTCRALADALLEKKPDLAWTRLIGWCLRPGTGVDGDARRVQRLWQARTKPTSRAELSEQWILWRRIAAGLDRAQQQLLFDETLVHTDGIGHARTEAMQLLAALERLSGERKEQAGERFWQGAKVSSYAPIGRLGTRAPLYGEPSDVVSRLTANTWLERLLALDWKRAEGAAFAATLLARLTGDAERDLDAAARQRVALRLERSSWIAMVTRVVPLSSADTASVLGEALPPGLRVSAG